jgi:hypothetical protein
MPEIIVNLTFLLATTALGGMLGYARGVTTQANGKVGPVGRWLTESGKRH